MAACKATSHDFGPSQCRQRLKSDDREATINVVDVYDIAADIGREFETLIDSHGAEHVTGLMQKVIAALEHLERLSGEKDKEQKVIEHLQAAVTHLKLEDSKKIEERHRNARELEQLEDHYKQETRDLLSTVKRLQDENRRLASSLAAANERDSAFSEDETYFEVDLVNKLETVIEKQRSQIKKLDRSLLDCVTENDELRCQNDQLTGCTRDLRRKLRSAESQLHLLVNERAELTAQAHDQQKQLQYLTRQLGIVSKDCEDLSIERRKEEAPDPNRPRFSLPELRNILEERNSLKARVSDLEDELAVFRPSKLSPAGVVSPSRSQRIRLSNAVANCDCSYHSRKALGNDLDDSDVENSVECDDHQQVAQEDLPVQGPMPEDPEDAPFRRGESGIRKLFKRVFGARVNRASYDEAYVDHHLVRNRSNSDGLTRSLSRFSFLASSRNDDPY